MKHLVLFFSLAGFGSSLACTLTLGPAEDECASASFSEIANSDELSALCRAQAEDELPEPVSEFRGRIDVLGDADSADGRKLWFVGADAEGVALTFVDTVLEVSVGGQALVEGEDFETCELGGSDLSISFVNDYSTSMDDDEMSTISSLERQLLQQLPSGHEAQVVYYNDEVELVQAATEDGSLLGAALSPDLSHARGGTAFYDGLGTGLDRLRARERPVRLLVVGSNGPDNASSLYERSTIVVTTGEREVFVVSLATFAADADELGDLQGPRAALFYGPSAGELETLVAPFIDAVASMGCIELTSAHADAETITLGTAGISTEWSRP